MSRPKRSRKRRQHRPVTLAEVDAFLASAVARRYFAFSDSNVKRRLIQMLLFLREEIEKPRQEQPAPAAPRWTERIIKKPSTLFLAQGRSAQEGRRVAGSPSASCVVRHQGQTDQTAETARSPSEKAGRGSPTVPLPA